MAALVSRSCRVPQGGQCHVRVAGESSASRCPHAEQVLLGAPTIDHDQVVLAHQAGAGLVQDIGAGVTDLGIRAEPWRSPELIRAWMEKVADGMPDIDVSPGWGDGTARVESLRDARMRKVGWEQAGRAEMLRASRRESGLSEIAEILGVAPNPAAGG
ncbi:hypothetical protein ABT294_30055 [Nonomuraea sp. NPDC000554]|uniref:hypothetical protein n=1 Tax=Nonomuraea sp. NPDC000554 TaxID=3154259 RepID=UPI0033257A99